MLLIKWLYPPSGNCPVQSEGYFLGYYFYFRSRGYQSTIEFANSLDDWDNDKIISLYFLWKTRCPYCAGWLPHWFCRVLVWWGCFRFLFKILKNKLQ